MRITLTLDDVAARLNALARRTGRSFRAVVKETLRRGLARASQPRPRTPFTVEARDRGRRSGVAFDDIGEPLDLVEGPSRR